MDSRHLQRIEIVQDLFAREFHDPTSPQEQTDKLPDTIDDILKHKKEIDAHIETHAPKYPIDRISKVDVNILRLALYEMLYDKKQPEKVIINEAVDLAKELGNERSYAFVNAVLGSFMSSRTV